MYIFLLLILMILFAPSGYCQDTRALLEQVSNMYGGSEPAGSNLIAGFTLGGLIGGILFSGVGFVAFMYGKKNSEFKPMILGVLLLGYPYFVRSTLFVYLIGIVLTVALFAWRD